MKKLFLPLMATTICALLTTGCVKGPDDIPPSPTPTPTPTPTPEESYDKAFKEYVGVTIASNQDWGFNASVAAARGMTRGSETGYYITDSYSTKYFSKSFYDAIFARLPDDGKKVPENIQQNFEFQDNGPFRFDIVFSCTLVKDIEIGYYHYGKDETPDKRKEVMLVQSLDRDLPTKAYYQYSIYSTPSETPGQWETPDAALGYNMFTVYNAKAVHTKMITLRDGSEESDPTKDVPVNDRVGFYVKINGKTYYTNRYLNDNEEDKYFAVTYDEKDGEKLYNSWVVGIEDLYDNDYDCNDIIIAVHKNLEPNYPTLITPEKPVPPTPPTPTTWRVIAEDLSASENTDFDFNDVVLDVTLTEDGADCVLQAAGGQLPIRINYDDNYEVHKLFGVDQKTMVNTNADKKGLPSAKKDSVSFPIKGTFKSVDDIVIQVYKNGDWHKLYAKQGDSACKILVDPTFPWPDEKESLKAVYPKFTNYVADPTVKWYPN